MSQNDCNKCALNNHESQYWPCDSDPPLCDCELELIQQGGSSSLQLNQGGRTTTTAATTTTTTATSPPSQSPTSSPTKTPTDQVISLSSFTQPTSPPSTSSPSPVPTTPPTKQPVTGSAGWYVDGNKCAFGEPTTETLYSSASECCGAQLRWISNELCVSLSTGVPTNKFYAYQTAGVCRQDCAVENGLPCGGSPQDTSLKLFNSLELCCVAKISWEPSCVDKSSGNEPQGSGKYYVNWDLGLCALDCPVGSAGCGGVANVWDLTYDTADACCSAISWIDRSKCVYQ